MSEQDALVEEAARRITKARYGGDVFMDNRQANPTTGDRSAARDIIAAVQGAGIEALLVPLYALLNECLSQTGDEYMAEFMQDLSHDALANSPYETWRSLHAAVEATLLAAEGSE